MIDVVIIALAVGFLRGGSLRKLLEMKLMKFPLIMAALLLRFLVVMLGARDYPFVLHYGPYIQIAAFLLLLYALFANGSSLRLVAFGVALNFIVIIANGGFMPVSAAATAIAQIDVPIYATHAFISEETRLWFLADIIPIPPPYPYARVISIGDFFLALGLFLFIQKTLGLAPREKRSS